MVASAADVVAFWQKAGPDRWFKKDPAFDDEIRERFLATYEAAAAGQLSGWEQSAEGTLALLILLDQFPRNMFRGEARAFATDPLARAITAGAIVRGFDSQVPKEMRNFFYLPFEHSEDLADQERGIALQQGSRRRGESEMGGNSRRHHPAIRTVSPSQCRPRPYHHTGRASLSRQRRFRRLKNSWRKDFGTMAITSVRLVSIVTGGPPALCTVCRLDAREATPCLAWLKRFGAC